MISTDWATIEAFAIRENTSVQWIEKTDRYSVTVSNGLETYWTEIFKRTPRQADQISFEDTYKASGNRSQGIKITGGDGLYKASIDSTGKLSTKANMQVGSSDVSTTNRVPVTDVLNLSISTSEKTSTSTASIVRVGVSNLTGRKAIEVYNTSTITIYVGASNVATSGANRGRPIPPNGFFSLDLSANVDLYIISASSATYVVTEVG